MLELLKHYSLTEIAFFIVLLAAAIKGTVTWFDWAKDRAGQKFESKQETSKVREELRKDIGDLKQSMNDIKNSVNGITKTIDLLIDSDKVEIKIFDRLDAAPVYYYRNISGIKPVTIKPTASYYTVGSCIFFNDKPY